MACNMTIGQISSCTIRPDEEYYFELLPIQGRFLYNLIKELSTQRYSQDVMNLQRIIEDGYYNKEDRWMLNHYREVYKNQ